MTNKPHAIHQPRYEHTVPWFWPIAAAIELGKDGMALFQKNLRHVAEVADINAPSFPQWATANRIARSISTPCAWVIFQRQGKSQAKRRY